MYVCMCIYTHTNYAHGVCGHQRGLLEPRGKQLQTLKEKPPNPKLKSSLKFTKGFLLALLSQMCLCECFFLWTPNHLQNNRSNAHNTRGSSLSR